MTNYGRGRKSEGNMAICQMMIKDFLFGWGGLGEYYDLDDLTVGADYALAWREAGYTDEPFWGYNLDKFVTWCEKQKAKIKQGEEVSGR